MPQADDDEWLKQFGHMINIRNLGDLLHMFYDSIIYNRSWNDLMNDWHILRNLSSRGRGTQGVGESSLIAARFLDVLRRSPMDTATRVLQPPAIGNILPIVVDQLRCADLECWPQSARK